MNENELKQLIKDISSVMSVTGFTGRGTERLNELIGGYFDEYYTDKIGNHIFVKKCGKENPKKILVDTHFDEIGFIVTNILDGGFLSITSVGGVDVRILQSADVVIYGTDENGQPKNIFGVVGSVPPHLQKKGDGSVLPEMKDIVIDTGYPSEELKKFAPVGTPVGFRPVYGEMANGRVYGKAFDDKACGACAVAAIAEADRSELVGDIYFMFSTFEEDGADFGGAASGTFAIDPDCAVVADVNFASQPGAAKDTIDMDGGISLTVGPMLDKPLTDLMRKLCEENGVKTQFSYATRSTGTNTVLVNVAGCGVPTVDIGLPLRCMHTPVETLSMTDAVYLKEAIRLFITSPETEGELDR